MSLRILLTGKNGQVGHELLSSLPALGELYAFDRHQLDLLSPEAIRRAIHSTRPQLIVNAAAYTAVDKAESEQVAAHAINTAAAQIIAEEAKKIGAAVIHYSTDYVFDGLKTEPYEETDLPNPMSVYGKTKLAGEQAIRESGAPYLIFRTAWVYATRGRNFLLRILKLAAERDELSVVRDQIGAPTWCREIAQATSEIVASLSSEGGLTSSVARFSGTYHMTAAGTTSWYDVTRAILEEARSAPADLSWLTQATGGRPLKVRTVFPITTEQYPTPARRPPYSVLSNELLNRTFGIELPDWREQLHQAFVSRNE
jgi:dTDP-4-dehydrorhamnose reductase